MSTLGFVKGALTFAVSSGVAAVVGNVVKETTPDDFKMVSKIAVGIGTVALSYMLGDMVAEYTSRKIDETIDGVNEAKKAFSEIKETVAEGKSDTSGQKEGSES